MEFLAKKGQNIDPSPNTKLTAEQYALVVKEYQGEKEVKKNADQLNNLIFKGKTITVGENDRPAPVEKKEEKVITIKTNSIPADEVNVPAKEEALADVKEPAKEQVAEPKAPVVEPAKETIEEPVEKPVKETVVEEKKEVVEETKIQEKVEVEPKVEKPVSEAAQDAVKLNVVGKIELPDVKKPIVRKATDSLRTKAKTRTVSRSPLSHRSHNRNSRNQRNSKSQSSRSRSQSSRSRSRCNLHKLTRKPSLHRRQTPTTLSTSSRQR